MVSRKFSLRKNYLYQQIESPHNTNEYLINNQSSPFFVDDDEDSILIEPSSIIHIENENIYGIELDRISLTFKNICGIIEYSDVK